MIEHMFDTLEATEYRSAWDDLDVEAFETLVASATAAAIQSSAQESHKRLPVCLDELDPGPALAAILSTIAADHLDGHDRVVVLRAHARMAAHFQAKVYAAMASVTDCMRDLFGDPVTGIQSAAAEIELALTLTRRAADAELAFALDLERRLPQVWDRFVAGDIDRRRARTIVHGVAHLPVAAARNIADHILVQAPDLTTGQIAARMRRLCLRTDADDAVRRYEHAVSERRISVAQNPSGTGNLTAYDLPADRVTAIRQRVHDLATRLKTAGEARTMDQLRTDVFLDLLEGRDVRSGSSRGVVDIQVDLATLARLSDAPGEVGGFGPVIADVARQMVVDGVGAEWRWTVTGDSGEVVANGITRRRPTAAMRRHVEARRRTCVFPGCRMPATRSDMDHRVPWSESRRTRTADLAPLCRHHHTVRHLAGWSYRTADGASVTWSTPLRHTYTRRGPPAA